MQKNTAFKWRFERTVQTMSDLVEVVRCKDCKYYKTDTPYCKEHNKGYCSWDGVIKTKKHYCSYGEREGGGND